MTVTSNSLTVGERIVYVTLADLEGSDVDQVPPAEKWRSAVIWRIDKCIHLSRK